LGPFAALVSIAGPLGRIATTAGAHWLEARPGGVAVSRRRRGQHVELGARGQRCGAVVHRDGVQQEAAPGQHPRELGTVPAGHLVQRVGHAGPVVQLHAFAVHPAAGTHSAASSASPSWSDAPSCRAAFLAGGPLPRVEHDRRVAHLHLMPAGNDRWQEQIDFRDALRANPALIAAYAAQTRPG